MSVQQTTSQQSSTAHLILKFRQGLLQAVTVRGSGHMQLHVIGVDEKHVLNDQVMSSQPCEALIRYCEVTHITR